jgi:hypothetical protein
MMKHLFPYYPTTTPKNLSATAASQSVQLCGINPQTEISLRVVNTGSKPVFLKFGKSDADAASSTTGMVVMNGAPAEVFNWPEGYTHLAYVCAGTDTTTLQVVLGRGGV